MNLQERLDRYRERRMQELDAQILVLIEESAAALFNSFPDHFILFGGVTLVLFHDSPRLSRDLDLLASPGRLPDPKEIQQVVRAAIQALAETPGLGQLEFRQDVATPALAKQWVLANQKPGYPMLLYLRSTHCPLPLAFDSRSVVKERVSKMQLSFESLNLGFHINSGRVP